MKTRRNTGGRVEKSISAKSIHMVGFDYSMVESTGCFYAKVKILISIELIGAGSCTSLMSSTLQLINNPVDRLLGKFKKFSLGERRMIIHVILDCLIRNFLDAFLFADECEQLHNVRIG